MHGGRQKLCTAKRSRSRLATRIKTTPKSLWEAKSGEARDYGICLPKTREVSYKTRPEARNDEPSRPREAWIEGETAVATNPDIPQALSATYDAINHEKIRASNPQWHRSGPTRSKDRNGAQICKPYGSRPKRQSRSRTSGRSGSKTVKARKHRKQS